MDFHKKVWPEVLEITKQSNIRNHTIYCWNGLLFRYFEYVGNDFEGDMAKLNADKNLQAWMKIIEPMLSPVENCPEGQLWSPIDEIGHWDYL